MVPAPLLIDALIHSCYNKMVSEIRQKLAGETENYSNIPPRAVRRYTMTYKTRGTCSIEIIVDVKKDHTIEKVEFIGGCSGNTQGVASLVKGMKAEEAIARMEGIRCGYKDTSCPDQLAQALKLALKEV